MGQTDNQNEILLSISNEISHVRGKDDMLYLIRNTLKKYIHFDDSFILLYNKDTKTYKSYIHHAETGRSGNPEFENQLGIEYPADDDSVGNPVIPVVQDVDLLLLHGRNQVKFIHSTGIKEFVTIKLIERNELTGLFVLLSERKNAFTTAALDLLQKISYPIAIATANIIANEEIVKREQEKTILLSLSSEISVLKNRSDLFKIVNGRVKKLFDIKEFGIANINEDGKTYGAFMMDLEEYITNDIDFKETTSQHYKVTDPLFEKVMNSEDPVIFQVNEIVTLPEMPEYVHFWKKVGLQQVLCAALRAGGKNIGMANLHIDKNKAIDPKSILLKGVIAQLSVAISNILAKEKIQKADEEKSLLLSFSNDIATVRDKEGLRIIIKQYLKNIFHIKEYIITTRNNDGNTYSYFMHDSEGNDPNDEGWKIMLSNQIPVKGAFIGAVLQSDEAIFVIEKVLKEGKFYFPAAAFWKAAGAKKVMGFRIKVADKDVGLLVIQPGQVNKQLLKGISAQLAIAIANIVAIEEIIGREKEKSMLLEFSNAMASIREKYTLSKVLSHQLKNLFGIEDYAIHALSEDKKTHRPVMFDPDAEFAKHPIFQQMINQPSDVNDGVFNLVLNAKEAVTFSINEWVNSTNPPIYTHAAVSLGIKKLTGVAIRLGDEAIAVMNFKHDESNRFNINKQLFKSICSQIAIVISNVLADDEIKGREKEKSMLLEFSNAIASVRDKNVLAKILKTQLTDLFAIKDYVIHALSDDKKTHRPILYDQEADFARHPDFIKLVNQQTDVNDGIFNKILSSDDPVSFSVEEWFHSPKPPVYANAARDIGMKNMAGIRIRIGNENIAVMNFRQDEFNLPALASPLFKSICSQLAITVSNIIANEKVNNQLSEINRYKQQLEEEKIYLKEEIETSQNFSEMIGESAEMKKVFRLIQQVSTSDSTVLILGETGTGKELVARAIHNLSPRKNKLMVKVNCAALPVNLIESELFGHERGSFTGAIERRIGKFELANHGTLFLDEIGEMPLELQVKLLRALQEQEIERVGGKTTIKVDVRIITATNRNLEKLMEEGKFRSDLYYRLDIFPISLPPLRKRSEDVASLALHFLKRFSKKTGKQINTFSNRALQELTQYNWPGNIRELEHLIERSVLLATTDTIKEIHLPVQNRNTPGVKAQQDSPIITIDQNEREYILKVLKHVKGKISGEKGAAELLGLPPSTLNSRMKRLGIRKEHFG